MERWNYVKKKRDWDGVGCKDVRTVMVDTVGVRLWEGRLRYYP